MPKVKSISLNENALIVETIRNKNILNNKLIEKNIKNYVLSSDQLDNEFYNNLLSINNQKFFLKKQFWIQSLISDINNKTHYNLKKNNLKYNVLNYNDVELTKNEKSLLNNIYNSEISKNENRQIRNLIFNSIENLLINKRSLSVKLDSNILLHDLNSLNRQAKMELVTTDYNNTSQVLNQSSYFKLNKSKLININNKNIPEEVLDQIDQSKIELKELKVNIAKKLATLENIKTDFINNEVLLTRFEKHISSSNVIILSKEDLPKPQLVKKKFFKNEIQNKNLYTGKYIDHVKENIFKNKNYENEKITNDKYNKKLITFEDLGVIGNINSNVLNKNTIYKRLININEINLSNIKRNQNILKFNFKDEIINKRIQLKDKVRFSSKKINTLKNIKEENVLSSLKVSNRLHKKNDLINLEKATKNDVLIKENIEEKHTRIKDIKEEKALNSLIVSDKLLKRNDLVNLEKTTKNDVLLKENIEEKYTRIKDIKEEKALNSLIVSDKLLKRNDLVNLKEITKNNVLKNINKSIDNQVIKTNKQIKSISDSLIKQITNEKQITTEKIEREILAKEKHINLLNLSEKSFNINNKELKNLIVKYNKSKNVINENLYLSDRVNKEISRYKSIFTAKINSLKKSKQILKGIKTTSRELTLKNNKITDINDVLENISVFSKLEQLQLNPEKIEKKYKLNKNRSDKFEAYKHLDNKIDYENFGEFGDEVMLYNVEEKVNYKGIEPIVKMVYKKPIVVDSSANFESKNSLNSHVSNGEDVLKDQVIKELKPSVSQSKSDYEEYTKKIQDDVDQKIEMKTKELVMEYMSDFDIEGISKKVLKDIESTIALQKRRYGIRS